MATKYIQLIGVQKLQGDDGKTPFIGENGNWWIGNTDTGVRAEGKDGTGVSVKSSASDCAEVGDAYIDSTTGHLMVLTELPSTFTDAGEIKGEKGDKGDKGDNVFIRYSAYADGTAFTETWNKTQHYIGFATGSVAPTNKNSYTWVDIENKEYIDSMLSQYTDKAVANLNADISYINAYIADIQGKMAYKQDVDDKFHEVETELDSIADEIGINEEIHRLDKIETDMSFIEVDVQGIKDKFMTEEYQKLENGLLADALSVSDLSSMTDQKLYFINEDITAIQEDIASHKLENEMDIVDLKERVRSLQENAAYKSQVADDMHEADVKAQGYAEAVRTELNEHKTANDAKFTSIDETLNHDEVNKLLNGLKADSVDLADFQSVVDMNFYNVNEKITAVQTEMSEHKTESENEIQQFHILKSQIVTAVPGGAGSGKAFRFSKIDATNQKFTLVHINGSNVSVDEVGYEAGDEYSFTFFHEYDTANGDSETYTANVKADFIGKILSVQAESDGSTTVTVDTLHYTVKDDAVIANEYLGNCLFIVPTRPDVGDVTIGVDSVTVGSENVNVGDAALVSGEGNINSGMYVIMGGKYNKGGYCGLIGGRENFVPANYGTAGGTNHNISGNRGTAFGGSHTVSSEYGFAGNRKNTVKAFAGTAFGDTNTVDTNATNGFIGGGTGNTMNKSNGFIGGGTGNTMNSNRGFTAGEGNTNDTGNNNGTMGMHNTVQSHMGFAGGQKTRVTTAELADEGSGSGYASFGWGNNLLITGGASLGGGAWNKILDDYGLAGGYSNAIYNKYCAVFGGNNYTSAEYQLVGGKFASPSQNAVLCIGNGTSADERSNAIEVLSDGTIVAPALEGKASGAWYADEAGYVSVPVTLKITNESGVLAAYSIKCTQKGLLTDIGDNITNGATHTFNLTLDLGTFIGMSNDTGFFGYTEAEMPLIVKSIFNDTTFDYKFGGAVIAGGEVNITISEKG